MNDSAIKNCALRCALERYRILDLTPEEGFDDLTALAAALCDTPIAIMSISDGDTHWIKSGHGSQMNRIDPKYAFSARVVSTADLFEIEDAASHPIYRDYPQVTGKPFARSYAGVPLITPGGIVIGALAVIDVRPRKFSAVQLDGLKRLARQVMSQLELRHVLKESDQLLASANRMQDRLDIEGVQNQQILDTVAEGIVCLDAHGFVALANPSALRILECVEDDLICMRLADIIENDPSKLIPGTSDACVLTGMLRKGECIEDVNATMRCPNGGRIPVTICARPMRIAGKDTGYAISFRNISGRLNARRKQFEIQSLLESIIDNAPAVVFVKEPHGRFLHVNRHFADNVGLPVSSIVGTTNAELFPPDVASYLELIDSRVMESKKSSQQEIVTCIDGQLRTMLGVAFPIFDVSGEIALVAVIATDITETKEYQESLRASEERYRMLFDTNPHPVLLVDQETLRIVDANAAAVRQYGYTLDEFKSISALDIRPTRELGRIRELFENQDDWPNQFGRHRHRRKDGSLLWAQISVHPTVINGRQAMVIVAMDVSQQVQEDREYRKQVSLFRLVTENVTDVIQIVDKHLRVRYSSPSTETVFGYTPEQIENSHVFDFVHPEDLDMLKAIVPIATASRGPGSPLRLRGRHKDGTWRYVEAVVNNCLDTPGIDGFLITTRDITERMKFEDDLRLRNRAIAAVGNGVIIVDAQAPDMPIVFVNTAFESITGYTAADVMGQNCRILQSGEPNTAARIVLRDALRNGHEANVVIRNKRKNGELFWNELYVSPIFDSSGVLTHFVGVQNDITNRITVEHALADSQERLDGILNSLDHIVWSLSADGNSIFYVNPAFQRIFGRSPDAFRNDLGQILSVIHPSDRDVLFKSRDEMIGTGHTERTLRIVRPDGEVRWLRETVVAARNDNGEVIRFDGISTDITDQLRMQEHLLQTEKLAALGELVAGVAHEINNPLSVISGTAQLLAMSGEPDVQEDSLTIKRMADRVGKIVGSLLTFARGREPEPTAVDLNKLVDEAVDLSKFRSSFREITLVVEHAESLPRVLADQGQIEQVLLNLISNAEYAVRFLPVSRKRIVIATGFESCDVRQSYVTLTVADTGEGMDATVMARIFDPFFTTKPVGHGTGLGLSVCHGIVKAHLGHLSCESVAGAGSRFLLKLPVCLATEKEEETYLEPAA